MRRRRREK